MRLSEAFQASPTINIKVSGARGGVTPGLQVLADAAAASAASASAAAAAASATVAQKQPLIPPLRPATYANAVRNRFDPSKFAGTPITGATGSSPVLSLTFDQAAYDNFAQMAVARMSDTVTAGNQPRFTLPVTIADLALVGLTPSDSTPPFFSARAAIQRATLVNQTVDASTSTNGFWYVILRYNGAGASLGGPLDAANDVAFLGTGTTPSVIGQGQSDPVWNVGSSGSFTLTTGEKILIRNKVPLRATYNGKALSGIILQFFGVAPASGAAAFSVGRIAIVPGVTVDQTANYLNHPEDDVSAVGTANLPADFVAKVNGAATEASVVTRLASNLVTAQANARAPLLRRPINRLPLDVDYATQLDLRNTSAPIVDLVAQTDLVERGYTKGIQWNAGNNFARWQSGVSQQNKYVFGCLLLYSTNPANLPALPPSGSTKAVAYSATAGGALTDITNGQTQGGIKLTERCVLLWTMGRNLTTDQTLMIGRSAIPVEPSTLFATGFTLFTSDLPFEVDGDTLAAGLLYQDATRREMVARVDRKVAAIVPTPVAGLATLTLAGEGYGVRSYVESKLGGYTLRRNFDPFNTISSPASPGRVRWLFNPREDIINGTTVRTAGDDATPDHIYGTTLGANHGYATGELTVTAHDKTTVDVGSVWSSGGAQYTLVGIKDANTIILTRRADNAAVPSGTFAHVSGATHTGGFTSSASVAGQWIPPSQDMTMRVLVDGQQVCVTKNGVLQSGSYSGSYAYRDTVQFIETYEVLPKSELLAWAEATKAVALYPTGRAGSLRVTNVYEYDRYAQMTVYRDWLFLADVPVADLMGLQLEHVGATTPANTDYYIPNTLPFTYNGATVNFSNIVPGDITLTAPGTPSIYFDSAKIEATGPYLERALVLYDAGFVDAAGFLPVADVAPGVRRAQVSVKGMEIRGDTGKRYFRVLDKGAFTAAAGDHYSAVGYRHVFPKSTKRTAFYTVRSREADYVHIDWHNFTGLDTIELPEELIGRSFTVHASKNATVKGDLLAGALSVSVSSAGAYGFLVLRVAK